MIGFRHLVQMRNKGKN